LNKKAGDFALGILNLTIDDSLRGLDFEFAGPEIMTSMKEKNEIIFGLKKKNFQKN